MIRAIDGLAINSDIAGLRLVFAGASMIAQRIGGRG
jgi:hypothetical protein